MARRAALHRDADRDRRLRARYGITAAHVDTMRRAQRYRCVICGTHEDHLPRGLVVDHDHTADVVRGLLCHTCNSGLGLFSDDPHVLTAAIAYLNMAAELISLADAER